MANPLFVTSTDLLKQKVRLAELPVSSSANAIFEEVLLYARLEFYRRLGEARVGFLLGIPFTDAPTTSDQTLRALASVTEVKIVLCELLRRLPVNFLDASGGQDQRYHNEAPYREMSDQQLEIQRCREEIEENMALLAGESDPGSECKIKATAITPDCPPPRIGDTLRPRFPNG